MDLDKPTIQENPEQDQELQKDIESKNDSPQGKNSGK